VVIDGLLVLDDPPQVLYVGLEKHLWGGSGGEERPQLSDLTEGQHEVEEEPNVNHLDVGGLGQRVGNAYKPAREQSIQILESNNYLTLL
jgi:hypothetical protein